MVAAGADHSRLALCDDVLVVVLHRIELPILHRLVDAARVVDRGRLRPHEHFGLATLATLLTIIVVFIGVRPVELVLRALVQRRLVLEFALRELRGCNLDF